MWASVHAAGETSVELPNWFEALDRHCRYQLTAIGAPGPNLYVADKIAGGSFTIAGGTPGMEVSWQVTAIRHDPLAEQQPTVVEQEKSPSEVGKYAHPGVYGKPETAGVGYAGKKTSER